MPCLMLSSLCVSSQLILPRTIRDRYGYYLYFKDEETEAVDTVSQLEDEDAGTPTQTCLQSLCSSQSLLFFLHQHWGEWVREEQGGR